MRRAAWLAVWPAGLSLGVVSAVVARRNPAYAFANSTALIAVELVAGYALIASGLAVMRTGQRRFGVLLAGAGCLLRAGPGARLGLCSAGGGL
jgi:hypothetical protein